MDWSRKGEGGGVDRESDTSGMDMSSARVRNRSEMLN